MDQITTIESDKILELLGSRVAPCKRWPLAGLSYEAIKGSLGLATDAPKPNAIRVKGLDQNYLVNNGYLLPNYPIETLVQDVTNKPQMNLKQRNETLIIGRATSFMNNAQPELGVPRTRDEINSEIGQFIQMPEGNHAQCTAKIGKFRILAGQVMKRLETLGKVIMQGNAVGTMLEYDAMKDGPISEPNVEKLKKEFSQYYEFLASPAMLPFMHSLLLHNRSVDTDGLLIELLREMGKPLISNERETENFVRGGIVDKIAYTVESIDQANQAVTKLLTSETGSKVFAHAVDNFIKTEGHKYGIETPADVLGKINRYAGLCRARACVQGKDPAYDEIFAEKEVMNEMFRSPNGLLQSMRQVGRGTSTVEIQKMRDILSQGLRLMERSAYTRIPCNDKAPEPWIPNLSEDAPPIEKCLTDLLLTSTSKERAARKFREAEQLPEAKREDFLRTSFSSLGLLRSSINELEKEMEHNRPWERFGTRASKWLQRLAANGHSELPLPPH